MQLTYIFFLVFFFFSDTTPEQNIHSACYGSILYPHTTGVITALLA